MGEVNINTRYISTHRGIIKIILIVCGFVVCSLLCSQWYGGRACFQEGRMGFVTIVNFVAVIVNVVLFILNVLNIGAFGVEKFFNMGAALCFLIASAILIWFLIDNLNSGTLFVATALLIVQLCLYLWDIKILQGEASN